MYSFNQLVCLSFITLSTLLTLFLMINTIEEFCNELCIFLSLKFGTNLLTPPVFISYLSAILEHYFDDISELISSFSGANG